MPPAVPSSCCAAPSATEAFDTGPIGEPTEALTPDGVPEKATLERLGL